MTAAVELFTYTNNHVRVLRDDAGEPLFVLANLCRVLGIANSGNVAARLPHDVKGFRHADTPGGQQSLQVVNESGMYEVVIRSDKPDAVDFRRWITGEVLPAIRKTGTYSRFPARPTALPSKKELAQWVVEAEERAEVAEAKVAVLEPKAEFYDDLMESDGTYSMLATSKILGWGRNVMMRELRRSGVLQGNNLPYQRYEHHFKVVPLTYTNSKTGNLVPTATTYVRPSGLEFLRKKLANSMAEVQA